MICPKCNQDNQGEANFCRGCGADLRQARQTLQNSDRKAFEEQTSKEMGNVCRNCGKLLKPGAAFCVSCGAKTDNPAGNQTDNLKGRRKEPDILTWLRMGGLGRMLGTLTAYIVNLYTDHKKLIRAGAAVLGILIAAVVMISQVGSKIQRAEPAASEMAEEAEPGINAEDNTDSLMQEASSDMELTAEEEAENARNAVLEEEIGKLWGQFEKASAAFDIGEYTGEDGCRTILDSLMVQCIELAQEYGAANYELHEIAQAAFERYADAVINQVDILYEQDIRPELYEQMMSDFGEGIEQADKLLAAGLDIQKSYLEDYQEYIRQEYYGRYIEKFNSFTEAENWSRTESWDLMQDAEKIGFVDFDEKDDPMTLRYAYALARITMKNMEGAINDGSMDADDAAEEIRSVLEETDYNLLLLSQLIDYCYQAGDTDDAEHAEACLEEILQRILETQGIAVGHDISLEKFWSFYEFDGTLADDTNGLTQENHEWIRRYMQDEF